MWFKKNNTNEYAGRARRPNPVGGLGTKPIFSYHAQPSVRPEPVRSPSVTRLFRADASAEKQPVRRAERRWPRRVLRAALVAVIVLSALGNLVLTRSPEIVVHELAGGQQLLLRSREVYQNAAQEILAGSLANTNKLTINTGEIAKELQKQFPELARVSVVLPVFGSQPSIHIQTAQPALVLASSQTGGVFLVDNTGRAIMEAAKVPVSVKEKLPVVQDQSGLLISVGGNALPSSNIDFITEVIGQLSAKGMQVSSMTLPPGGSELHIWIEGAPYFVKFNLRGDARVGAGAFMAVKQHLEREGKTPSSYIDVRVENKAYYR